jgi:hypothetical protein
VNLIVLPTDCQKIGSFASVTKLPRPTKVAGPVTSRRKKLRYTP